MSRKRNRAASTDRDVRVLPTRSKILLLFACEDTLRRGLAALPLAQSEQANKGPGRPRDPRLDRAASLYVAAVRTKEKMRAMGYGGLTPDKHALQEIARQCFPEVIGNARALDKAMERIKNAVRKYRRATRG